MSMAKDTSTEIAKALTEVISDKEGEPHNKKPRRVTHKNNVDDKKKKQVAASVCKALPSNKYDLACDSNPLRILPLLSLLLYLSGNLLEINDVIESKWERVESLLPMINLAARSVSQNVVDNFSHLLAVYALEVLTQNQIELGINF